MMHPEYNIQFHPVVMGILTSTRQRELEQQLEWLGTWDNKGVKRVAAVAAVRANVYVLRQRREKLTGSCLG
jgi:hypothetical protein